MQTVIVILLLIIISLVGAGVYLMYVKNPQVTPGPVGHAPSGVSVIAVRDGRAGRRFLPADMDGFVGNEPGGFNHEIESVVGDDDDPRLARLLDPDISGEERRALEEDLRSCGYVVRGKSRYALGDGSGLVAEGDVDPDTLLSEKGEGISGFTPSDLPAERSGDRLPELVDLEGIQAGLRLDDIARVDTAKATPLEDMTLEPGLSGADYDDDAESRQAIELMGFIARAFREGLISPELVRLAENRLNIRVNPYLWSVDDERRARLGMAVYGRDQEMGSMPLEAFETRVREVVAAAGKAGGGTRPVTVFPDRHGGKDDIVWSRLGGDPGGAS